MCFSLIFFPFQYLLGNKCSQESVSDIVSIFSSYWLSFSSQPLSESKLTSARAESDSEWTVSDEQPTFSKLACVCVCLHCFRCSSCVSYRFASIFNWFVHRHTMPLHVSFRWKYVCRLAFGCRYHIWEMVFLFCWKWMIARTGPVIFSTLHLLAAPEGSLKSALCLLEMWVVRKHHQIQTEVLCIWVF